MSKKKGPAFQPTLSSVDFVLFIAAVSITAPGASGAPGAAAFFSFTQEKPHSKDDQNGYNREKNNISKSHSDPSDEQTADLIDQHTHHISDTGLEQSGKYGAPD